MVHGFWPILAQPNRPNFAYFIRLLSQAQSKGQIIHCHQQPPPSATGSQQPPPAATFRPTSGDISPKKKKTQGYTLSLRGDVRIFYILNIMFTVSFLLGFIPYLNYSRVSWSLLIASLYIEVSCNMLYNTTQYNVVLNIFPLSLSLFHIYSLFHLYKEA
jgi:hypothetical protein